MGGFRHLRQRLQNLLFGVIDVLQRIEEEVVEVLVFVCCGHGKLHRETRDAPRVSTPPHAQCSGNFKKEALEPAFRLAPALCARPPEHRTSGRHAASVFSTSLIQYEVPNTIASSLKL